MSGGVGEGDGNNDSQGEFGSDSNGNLAGSPANVQAEASLAPEASQAETEAVLGDSQDGGRSTGSFSITGNQVSSLASLASLMGFGPVGLALGLGGAAINAFGGGSLSFGGFNSSSNTSNSNSTSDSGYAGGSNNSGLESLFSSADTNDPLEELRKDYLRFSQNRTT